MKKIFTIAVVIFVAGTTYYAFSTRQAEAPGIPEILDEKRVMDEKTAEMPSQVEGVSDLQTSSGLQSPLSHAGKRVTKKPFGIYVTPQDSPVQPEKFHGYHTGTDFEIFPEELDAEVAVKAVCSGELKMKTVAAGYGGVAVQACNLDGSPITVIYGHLNLFSVDKNIGEDLKAGEEFGFLGKGFSSQTSGERKHLHLGIHNGAEINILGYVQQRGELSAWIDPCSYVCENP